MKIAILSDARLPTSHQFPGHGLGKIVLHAAEALADRGHQVTLYAAPGSAFDKGDLLTADDEREFMPVGFDVVLDATHHHLLQRNLHDVPIVNWSQDREAHPGKCAVYPSKAHQKHHGGGGRVVYNGIPVPGQTGRGEDGYFAYLSMLHAPKGPIMAMEAARLAGVRLVMAGPTPPCAPPGVEYIGPLFGEDKFDFLRRARALIFPASTEAGALTPLEAQAVGTPVICTVYGAARENVVDDEYAARDTLEMAETVKRYRDAPDDKLAEERTTARQWVQNCRSVSTMTTGLEHALIEAAAGKVW